MPKKSSPEAQPSITSFFKKSNDDNQKQSDEDSSPKDHPDYGKGVLVTKKFLPLANEEVDPLDEYVNDHGIWVNGKIVDYVKKDDGTWKYKIRWNAKDAKAVRDLPIFISQLDVEFGIRALKFMGIRVAKEFYCEDTDDMVVYEGSIVDIIPAVFNSARKLLFTINYSDGDEEDLSESEIDGVINLFKKRAAAEAKMKRGTLKKRGRPPAASKSPSSPPKSRRRITKAISNDIEINSDTDDDDDVEELPTKPVRQSRTGGRVNNESNEKTRPGRRATKVTTYTEDSDDDDDSALVKQNSELKRSRANYKQTKKTSSINDDDMDASHASASESDSSEDDLDMLVVEEETVTKPKRTKVAIVKSKQTKKAEPKSTKPADEAEKPEKKKMSESFTPINTPVYSKFSLEQIAKTKDYLDPCGMEATDDILDREIGKQVDRIGSLLSRAIAAGSLGSLENRLKLGTACSGTDAPSLALSMVKEQWELRKMKQQLGIEHVFSCEKEPFKQAYLARNFDSILYPDICKLGLEDQIPRDVYGQETPLPEMNMFVAGTVCKNFSMLRSKYRIDIEDKGESGETFLAATEVLWKEQPETAIFENVMNAPWSKMQEYITGRVKLSSCSDKKAIKATPKDSKRKLLFEKGSGGDIIVTEVAPIYGIRCGAVVRGFCRGKSTKVLPISWPSRTTGKNAKACTLPDLIKANGISSETDMLIFKTPCTYCTHIAKVDTKLYGLPQTRQRVYMFVWKPKNDDIHDDLGTYWEAIVSHLKSPVQHSLDAFMLDDNHDVIRVFREALNGPPGRQSKRETFQEPDFWASESANLPHNRNTRAALGLEDEARFLTNWGPFGKKQLPLHFWPEYINCNTTRIIDFLDILNASSFRDAESHDPNYTSYFWNVSQNASKEKHRAATPGIAGCITPGGDFFIPHRGRPLLGCEKLLMQGIPYFRLLLGNETEVQLGDLAGNAMSLTVVSATMLAALTCTKLREEIPNATSDGIKEYLSQECQIEESLRSQIWTGKIPAPICSQPVDSLENSDDLFRELASLASEAVACSIWCTCESSGTLSKTSKFLECKVCRISCCRNCTGSIAGYNVESHQVCETDFGSDGHCFRDFQTRLRQLVPPTLRFSAESFDQIVATDDDCFRVNGLSQYGFNLHKIKRDRKRWLVIYYARDNNGIGEALAELRITIGEIKRESKEHNKICQLGMLAELTCFMPAKTTPLKFGSLEPFAKLYVFKDSREKVTWLSKGVSRDLCVDISGSGKTDSPRVDVGLTRRIAGDLETTAKSKTNVKHYQEAHRRGESRRWLYAKNWMEWPDEITIEAEPNSKDASDMCILGSYHRTECRQSVNQSALWVKAASSIAMPAVYIVVRPRVNRTGPDVAVISSSIDANDLGSILAEFSSYWQPCDALNDKYRRQILSVKIWNPVTQLACQIPPSTSKTRVGQPGTSELACIEGLSATEMGMFDNAARFSELNVSEVKLDVLHGQKAQQIVRVFNAICSAKILNLAAQNLPPLCVDPRTEWNVLKADAATPFGRCKKTVPERPCEEWKLNDERSSWERTSSPGAARTYYLQLQEAPQAFEVWINRPTRSITVKYFPKVVGHHATHMLINGRGSDIENDGRVAVMSKLSDTSLQEDPNIVPFKVKNCDEMEEAGVLLGGDYKLYKRQQRVVTKMQSIERGGTIFEEEEMSEYQMPGSTGLSLIAKATRNSNIRGGVIADAIGAGKTVISIAIILQGIEDARNSRQRPAKSGASLVVVPPGLIGQWKSEIQKFAKNLKVVQIFDCVSLKKLTLQEILHADAVICPIDILESKGYFDNLVSKANAKAYKDGIPELPSYAGHFELTAARGNWIPATSDNPYGGGNDWKNQRRRDQSAHYTYVYERVVATLRGRAFNNNDRGVPLEFFEWERIFVDEIHESLCTTKAEVSQAKEQHKGQSKTTEGFFTEKNRRAGRELLGLTQRSMSKRPLRCRLGIFGLTGTPLLDSTSRVCELANLMGGVYVTGLSSHWRKLERESCRDIFLMNYLEPKQSREIRKTIYRKCQQYLDVACCRNKAEDQMKGIQLVEQIRKVQMTKEEKEAYLSSQSGIVVDSRSLGIKPEDFDPSAGHDISKFLRQNSKQACRGKMLVTICNEILDRAPTTKIVVFCDGRIDASLHAREALQQNGMDCTWLDQTDSVELKNEKISWYQVADATDEDRKRPRILLLNFEHAAGLNLQTECYNLILFSPLYVGNGGSSSDAVSDVSTELQAIGRVMRPGQLKPEVHVYRIEVKGPQGEDCLDAQLIRRNTDEDVKAEATNAG